MPADNPRFDKLYQAINSGLENIADISPIAETIARLVELYRAEDTVAGIHSGLAAATVARLKTEPNPFRSLKQARENQTSRILTSQETTVLYANMAIGGVIELVARAALKRKNIRPEAERQIKTIAQAVYQTADWKENSAQTSKEIVRKAGEVVAYSQAELMSSTNDQVVSAAKQVIASSRKLAADEIKDAAPGDPGKTTQLRRAYLAGLRTGEKDMAKYMAEEVTQASPKSKTKRTQ